MKKILPYILTGLVTAIAVYLFIENQQLKSNAETEGDADTSGFSVEQRNEIARADSLLLAGSYEEAQSAYDNLPENVGLEKELRRKISTKIRNLDNQLRYATSKRPGNTKADTANLNTTDFDLQQMDSLSFALTKAQLELKNIRMQMQQKVFGEYLTFKSKKGNRLHYVGEVKNKKANGLGIAILDTGSRYEGEWRDGMRHGKGTFYWIDGEHYEGNYVNDMRSGTGTYYWPNGEKFTGEWKDDLRNGAGVFYGKDGEVIASGIWKDDKLVEQNKDK
ncbi:MORN repeat-containing protein [Leeuwenhoekiella nanhaiensis]|uniref:Uncharacterized protein n=1 Tax=Leeuwenhoekiella nanhaiensis TaxID=1655491 RepID=A0A2G1VT22_9FLAO|nr:hypothetical protein [Leeuwenhoekiella nanhaiensis]PHQ29905.1 hypothetical protein CJ305_08010 [Leeuwenhoekiella nanhaiensis]